MYRRNVEDSLYTFLDKYDFKTNASGQTFPKIPQLDSIYTKAIFNSYYRNTDKTFKSISYLYLKFCYSYLKQTGMSTNLIENQTELDSLKNPLLFIYLKATNQYDQEKMYKGINSFNLIEIIKNKNLWPNDTTIQNQINRIELLEKEIINTNK